MITIEFALSMGESISSTTVAITASAQTFEVDNFFLSFSRNFTRLTLPILILHLICKAIHVVVVIALTTALLTLIITLTIHVRTRILISSLILLSLTRILILIHTAEPFLRLLLLLLRLIVPATSISVSVGHGAHRSSHHFLGRESLNSVRRRLSIHSW